MRLPREMQRAMAAEAEATREASAKVCSVRPEKLQGRVYVTYGGMLIFSDHFS